MNTKITVLTAKHSFMSLYWSQFLTKTCKRRKKKQFKTAMTTKRSIKLEPIRTVLVWTVKIDKTLKPQTIHMLKI